MPNPTVIKPGDIMLKRAFAGEKSGAVIKAGQKLVSQGPAEYVHAGLAIDDTRIVEMDGEGLQIHDLTNENAQYLYDVFRCNDRMLAQGAAEVSKLLFEVALPSAPNRKDTRIAYSILGAVMSSLRSRFLTSRRDPLTDLINGYLDQMLAGKAQSFFCSEHVVVSYQIAIQQTFALQGNLTQQQRDTLNSYFPRIARDYNPSFLYAAMNGSNVWGRFGTVQGGQLLSI